MPSIIEMLNGRLKLVSSIGAGAVFLVVATLAIEDRYAKADDFRKVQAASTTIIDTLKMQYQSRLAVLQLKDAQGELTPSERVELQGLVKILESLTKKGY